MLDKILAQMNAGIQPGDQPFTEKDALQHVVDYDAWGRKASLDSTMEMYTDRQERMAAYRRLIVETLGNALELATKYRQESQTHYDNLPAHHNAEGRLEYENDDDATEADREWWLSGAMVEQIQATVSKIDDWLAHK